MRFDVVTIFPDLFASFLRGSLIGKALTAGLFGVGIIDLRDHTEDRHRTVDDRPFGGGPGMVLKPEPLARAIAAAREIEPTGSRQVILLAPAGRPLTQARVEALAGFEHLILVCGRYEGVDERVARTMIDETLSIGDYVLSGGEIPAMVLIEAVSRLLPGVLGREESTTEETFAQGLLEYPHYTRPRVFADLEVPEILLSGNHAAIRAWRLEQSVRRTLALRPDLLDRARERPEVAAVLKRIAVEDRKAAGDPGIAPDTASASPTEAEPESRSAEE